jgi:hypothetical protein
MKTLYEMVILILEIVILLVLVFVSAYAQRGNIAVPAGAEIFVPDGAQICADTVFANNPGYGTLRLANASGLCNGSIVIPVEFLVFSAAYGNGAVRLLWRTASETNCAGYEVQRTAEPDAWRAIGYVFGRGTTKSEQAYCFDDRLTGRENAGMLYYRLEQIDLDGRYEYSPVVEVWLSSLSALPGSITLDQNYPNPFNPSATIEYSIPEETHVRLIVCDLLGKPVAILIDGIQSKGNHSVLFDAKDLPSGIYFYHLEAGGKSVQRFMTLMK